MKSRQAKPWYRRARKSWYCTLNGRQVNMGISDPNADPAVIEERVRQMVAEEVRKELRKKSAEPVPPVVGEPAEGANRALLDPDAPVIRDGKVWELVAEYRAEWLGHLVPETFRVYCILLDWFATHFGAVPIRDVRAKDVERKSLAEDWSDGYRRLCLAVVQGFIRWAGRTAFRMEMPTGESRGEEVVLTPDEADRLIGAAKGDFKALLEFLRYSWCRPGEARKLTVESVNWDHLVITLKKHKTKKKGKQRAIYLTPLALEVLTRQKEKYGSGPLFRNANGAAFTMDTVNSRMRRLRKKVGLRDDIISYSFRHTGATRALEEGIPDSDVAALLGHSGTTMIYKHYSHVTANARRLRDVATRMDGKA